MLKELGFYRGVNLGGWMSQCDYSAERLDGFITEPDFERIARWGFDHVRSRIDSHVLQNEDGSMKEDGLRRIDRALALCEKYGLRAVLDLHKTQGFSFDAAEGEEGFFASEKYQAFFYAVWECFAARYSAMFERVAFELLNEVTEETYLPAWKRISAECIRRIRALAPQTVILLGSYHHNSAKTLEALDAPQDERVLYNFHCYEPIEFTHQGAHWMESLKDRRGVGAEACGVSERFFEDFLASAFAKAEREGAELYCGEYGVIDVVPPEEALKWFRALHAVLERHGVSRAVWSYKQMDFGLSDARLDGVRDELLTLL